MPTLQLLTNIGLIFYITANQAINYASCSRGDVICFLKKGGIIYCQQTDVNIVFWARYCQPIRVKSLMNCKRKSPRVN
jgi:hypothetical protein